MSLSRARAPPPPEQSVAFDGGIYGTVYAKIAMGIESGFANVKKANGGNWQPSYSSGGRRFTLNALAVHMAAVAAGDAVHPSPQKRIKVETQGMYSHCSICLLLTADTYSNVRPQVRRGHHFRIVASMCHASS